MLLLFKPDQPAAFAIPAKTRMCSNNPRHFLIAGILNTIPYRKLIARNSILYLQTKIERIAFTRFFTASQFKNNSIRFMNNRHKIEVRAKPFFCIRYVLPLKVYISSGTPPRIGNTVGAVPFQIPPGHITSVPFVRCRYSNSAPRGLSVASILPLLIWNKFSQEY